MKTNNYAHLGKLSAIISFTIGTFIFLLHSITGSNGLPLIGLTYLIIAILTNLVMLFILIVRLLINKHERNQISKSILLMLINIPIAYLYMSLVTL